MRSVARIKKGLPQEDSPALGKDAILLFAVAEFIHQNHCEDYWQKKQREHEEKSKAHHGNCLLSCFV